MYFGYKVHASGWQSSSPILLSKCNSFLAPRSHCSTSTSSSILFPFVAFSLSSGKGIDFRPHIKYLDKSKFLKQIKLTIFGSLTWHSSGERAKSRSSSRSPESNLWVTHLAIQSVWDRLDSCEGKADPD